MDDTTDVSVVSVASDHAHNQVMDVEGDSSEDNSVVLFCKFKNADNVAIAREHMCEIYQSQGKTPQDVDALRSYLNTCEQPAYELAVVKPLREWLTKKFTDRIAEIIHLLVFSLGVPSHYKDDPFVEDQEFGTQAETRVARRGTANTLFLQGVLSGTLYDYIVSVCVGVPMKLPEDVMEGLLGALAGAVFMYLPGYEFYIRFVGSSTYLVSLNPDKKLHGFRLYGSREAILSRNSRGSDLDVVIFIDSPLERTPSNVSKVMSGGDYMKYTRQFSEKTLMLQSVVLRMRERGVVLDVCIVYTKEFDSDAMKLWNDKRFRCFGYDQFNRDACLKCYFDIFRLWHQKGLKMWLKEQPKCYARCGSCGVCTVVIPRPGS